MTRKTVTPSPLAGSSATATSMPWCANSLVEWLLTEGLRIRSTGGLMDGLCRRMVARGMPLWRMHWFIRILHPQVFGTIYTWRRDRNDVEEFSAPHSVLESALHVESPCAAIFDGAAAVRRRLDIPSPQLDFPILKDLVAEGATDYVSIPFPFSDGQVNVVSVTADRQGGFNKKEMNQIQEMLPVLGRLIEVQVVRRTAAILLDTYLGVRSGKRVLNGVIKRGDGEDIHAVIWFCDLRGSTRLADSMSRDAFLGILNDFFDCMAGAVQDHGGEVLRFIGDAALAVFSTDNGSAGGGATIDDRVRHSCQSALMAAADARDRMGALNHRRVDEGKPLLGYGLALHIGEVTYGNIGAPNRLEFTIVGAAANEAAKLQEMCKILNEPILISEDVARCFPGDLVSLGRHALHELGTIKEIFTLPPGKN